MTMRSWQDNDVLSFLGKEAPRYTSYPSAHHFGDLGADTYAGWLKAMRPEQSVALYLHIPFCEQMCHFCGCNTRATRRYEPVTAYVDALCTEIDLVTDTAGFAPKVHAIHFGGGSPSMLEPADIGRIMEALDKRFAILKGAEISIELDPRHVIQRKVKTYKALGFNRVSMGIQDTDADVQKAINRIQPIEQIEAAFSLLRSHGLNSIGIDLVYGLPGQTTHSLVQTLADVGKLNPDRISAFSYAHVPWVKKHQTLINTDTLADTAEKAAMFIQISDHFTAHGYEAIGIDHFAKPDDELALCQKAGTLRRNFMGYSTLPNDHLIGLGASSLGEFNGGIAQNIPQSTTYINRINAGELATVRGWVYRDDDKLRKAIISALMCHFTADVGSILIDYGYNPDYFDVELSELAPFVAAGLVTLDHRQVTFHSPLKMLIRSVACVFDAYARESSEAPRYSKVA